LTARLFDALANSQEGIASCNDRLWNEGCSQAAHDVLVGIGRSRIDCYSRASTGRPAAGRQFAYVMMHSIERGPDDDQGFHDGGKKLRPRRPPPLAQAPNQQWSSANGGYELGGTDRDVAAARAPGGMAKCRGSQPDRAIASLRRQVRCFTARACRGSIAGRPMGEATGGIAEAAEGRSSGDRRQSAGESRSAERRLRGTGGCEVSSAGRPRSDASNSCGHPGSWRATTPM